MVHTTLMALLVTWGVITGMLIFLLIYRSALSTDSVPSRPPVSLAICEETRATIRESSGGPQHAAGCRSGGMREGPGALSTA